MVGQDTLGRGGFLPPTLGPPNIPQRQCPTPPVPFATKQIRHRTSLSFDIMMIAAVQCVDRWYYPWTMDVLMLGIHNCTYMGL